MMGSLASLDDYVDWYNQTPMRGNAAPPPPAPPTGTTYDPMADRAVERPEPPQDPRAFTSEWARASGVYPGSFEPQGTQWPQYPPAPPKEVAEDRPNPLIPFSAYRSKPPQHRVGDIAAQNIIEQGFGALPAGRLGMGTALTLDPSPAEGAGLPRLRAAPTHAPNPRAVIGGNRPPPELGVLADPTTGSGNWMIRHVEGKPVMSDEGTHGFSALRSGKIPADMSYQIANAPTPNRNVWDIADLEGKDLIFGVKDRTPGGGELTHVGERKLRSPVPLEAGADYTYLHEGKAIPGQDPDTARIFASASQAAASKLNNEALRSIEAGRDPIFTSMVMARGAGDSSKQVAMTAYQLAKQSRPSDEVAALIDRQMRANLAAEKVQTSVPFPGFGSGKLGAWLDSEGLKARGAFVRALDTKGPQAGGIPDIGEVRYAHTDPRLRTTPTGSSGLFMARMRPDLEAGAVDSLHSNYPATILGSKSERGGLAGSVPFHIIAPDRHRELLAAGEPRFFSNNPAQLVMTNMPTGITKTQTVTPEVVDRVSEFFRRYPKGYSFVGGAPVMGGLAASHAYQPDEERL